MKKSKLIIVIVALLLLATVLVGCISVSAQKVLGAPWKDYEAITYDVLRILPDNDDDPENNPVIKGTQVVTTERITKGSVKVGANPQVDNFTGSYVTFDMTLEDGSYMKGEVAFSSKFVPVASSRQVFVKGWAENGQPDMDIRQNLTARYEGKQYKYSALLEELVDGTVTNSQTKEDSIALKAWDSAPYIDSLMVYHVGRSSFTGTKNGEFRPFAFGVPSFDKNKLMDTSSNLGTAPDVELNINEVKYKTKMVGFAYTQKFPGTGEPLWANYNADDLDGLGKHVPMKMKENNMVYTYKSHSTTKA